MLAGQLEETRELVLYNRAGELLPVMVSSIARRDRKKVLLGTVIIIRDLTPIKRLENERRQLVNMFAHDLKTPVVGMAGLIRRLLRGKTGPLSPEQKSYLETIDREMTRVEKDHYQFPRVRPPRFAPADAATGDDPGPGRVPGSRHPAHSPLAEAKSMRLETRFPPQLPSLRVDPLLFRRLLENLLGNAIKFSPPGSVVLLQVWDEPQAVRFAVQDQVPASRRRTCRTCSSSFFGARRRESRKASAWVWPR